MGLFTSRAIVSQLALSGIPVCLYSLVRSSAKCFGRSIHRQTEDCNRFALKTSNGLLLTYIRLNVIISLPFSKERFDNMHVSRKLVGEKMNVATFGRIMYWTGSDPLTLEAHVVEPSDGVWSPVHVPEQGGAHIGVQWDEPRRFSSIVVRYAEGTPVPSRSQVKVQYWHHTWPEKWAGGWTAVDDPFNGKWVTAHDNVEIHGNTWVHTFDPLDIVELPQADDFAVYYRQALKVRLLFKGIAPKISSIEVLSTSVWRQADLRVEFLDETLSYSGQVEAHNGYVVSLDDSEPRAVLLSALYADGSPCDKTVLTVKSSPRSFSFLVTDAVEEGVYIPDFGVFVGRADGGGFDAWDRARRDAGIVPPIYDRILTESEQSYERAAREIPQLKATKQPPYGRYCPIGCDGNRQEFAVRYNGDIFADKRSMKVVGRDTARLLWPGSKIFYRIGSGNPPDFREREGATEQEAYLGYMPIYTSRWKDREIEYELTTFAGMIYESPWGEEKKRGDEPIAAISRLRVRNTTEESRVARFWVVIESPEELEVEEEGFVYAVGRGRDDRVSDSEVQKRWVVERYDKRRMRLYIDRKGRGDIKAEACTYAPYEVSGIRNGIAYDIELEARKRHEIEFVIPFVTYVGDEGREEVRKLKYEVKFAEMVEYWQSQIDAGAKLEVPEELLVSFNKANIAHIAITADKDVETGLYILGAGTWDYQAFGTESIDQIRSLDLRGYHERARKYLQPFVELQGTRRMDGRFKTQEGVFQGLRVSEDLDYHMGDYSLDHGSILWWLGEHYLLTRDKEWLRSVAPNIVAACDYVARERQATMLRDSDGSKVWEYGLLPPCHLDDNPEWLYWYITNILCYRGLRTAGQALAEIGSPDAERIAQEATAYGEDIRRALAISVERSPVVRLLDGTYVPHTPVRCRLRGRDVGWIREALYGAIFPIDGGIIPPDAPEATWILKDYEDNIFVSRTTGRQVDLERFWFSQGGITIQSNLLPNPIVYLMRDQAEHAIRAFYNSFAANLYADVRCFTEHPILAYGIGAGPFYKTPDESAFLTWFRYLLLMEKNDALVLCPGTPRKWLEHGKEIKVEGAPTYFGPTSYRVVSDVDNGRIHVELQPPRRNPPARIVVTLRHPNKSAIKSVRVNGQPHSDFDSTAGRIILPGDLPDRLEILAEY